MVSPPAVDIPDDSETASCPFEGPEKLLEIWFTPPAPSSPVVGVSGDEGEEAGGMIGLRTVDRAVWEEMLDIVQCKVLSVIRGRDMDAYLLSESSFFVFPHKLILKTCGTTLNLLGLPRILAIAKDYCNLSKVWRCFYSRKSFMFPEMQVGPHREWRDEVEYLDALFEEGAAYTVGKVNGDHWLLYITSPAEEEEEDGTVELGSETVTESGAACSADALPITASDQDYTIEILMTKLSASARRPFFFLEEDAALIPPKSHSPESESDPKSQNDMHHHDDVSTLAARKATLVSTQLGINTLFPASQTKLDSYAFEPCGYSANALITTSEEDGGREGYYTIHVTPEEGWSYASFECNVPVTSRSAVVAATANGDGHDEDGDVSSKFPDLETLIQRVVNIFQPGHISLTLFVSSAPESASEVEVPIESAQKVFRQALTPRGYKRTDKINYEFGGYDLAFATFQKKSP